MNNTVFVDFDLIENEKSRRKIIDVINKQSFIYLLTEDKNNITKAYLYGVEVIIRDAISKSPEEIENVLRIHNKKYSYNETTCELEIITWNTLNMMSEKNISPYDQKYTIFTSIDVPDWMKEHVKTI